jgi:hypothetical protein
MLVLMFGVFLILDVYRGVDCGCDDYCWLVACVFSARTLKLVASAGAEQPYLPWLRQAVYSAIRKTGVAEISGQRRTTRVPIRSHRPQSARKPRQRSSRRL